MDMDGVQRTKPVMIRRPSEASTEQWISDGVAKSPDGCAVELDGTCPHGQSSWLLIIGLI